MSSEWRERGAGAILFGLALLLLGGLLLSWVYAWSMVDPNAPDYYAQKREAMVRWPDPGLGTWLGVALSAAGAAFIAFGVVYVACPAGDRPPPAAGRGGRD
jgi:hypothetical protein